MSGRTALLAAAAVVCGSAAAIVSYWAVENVARWYHNRYVELDYSAAEADAVMLWIQVPSAVLLWAVSAFLVYRAFDR